MAEPSLRKPHGLRWDLGPLRSRSGRVGLRCAGACFSVHQEGPGNAPFRPEWWRFHCLPHPTHTTFLNLEAQKDKLEVSPSLRREGFIHSHYPAPTRLGSFSPLCLSSSSV